MICLAEGTWEESLVIGKGLTLRGLGPEKSVIQGLRYGEPVILIYSDAEIEVTVEGLTIARGDMGWCATWYSYGLSLGGKVKATISGNSIWGNMFGFGIGMGDSAQATISGNSISGNAVGIVMGGSAQANIEGNKITENAGYGVALFQRPCYDTDSVFEGAVRGRGNEIWRNNLGEVCPAELKFLMTEAGGCYGPKC